MLTCLFFRYGSKLVTTKLPTCRHLTFDTDEYWDCAVRSLSGTLHHQVTTCKMGPPNDPEAIVNHELKVYGVSNLRVVDLSVIPMMISAHTNVPSYMIGEKAADLIKQEWNPSNKNEPFYSPGLFTSCCGATLNPLINKLSNHAFD